MARRKRSIAIKVAGTSRPAAKAGFSWSRAWSRARSWAVPWLFAAAMVAAVFLTYRPVWHGGFIWDDDLHLLENPVLQPGGWLTTWVPGTHVNYWPVDWEVYRIEYAIWGLEKDNKPARLLPPRQSCDLRPCGVDGVAGPRLPPRARRDVCRGPVRAAPGQRRDARPGSRNRKTRSRCC